MSDEIPYTEYLSLRLVRSISVEAVWLSMTPASFLVVTD